MPIDPITLTGPTSGALTTQYAHGLPAEPLNVLVQAVVPEGDAQGAGSVNLYAPYWDAANVYLEWSDYGLTAQLTFFPAAVPTQPVNPISSGIVSGGFCAVTDVTNSLSTFQRNQPLSTPDSQIEGWICGIASEIVAELLQRGFNARNPPQPLTSDQQHFLRLMNADGAVGLFVDAQLGNVTLQPGESVAASVRTKRYEQRKERIHLGRYDALLGLGSRLGGYGGAETARGLPPGNQAFTRNPRF